MNLSQLRDKFTLRSNKARVVTHNGQFHADDCMALAVVEYLLEDHVTYVRTRDPEKIKEADIVVDVGGVYDSATLRFDHHQVSNSSELARKNGVPYAAAGLVWNHFGLELLGMQKEFDLVDQLLFQSIDASDCGFRLTDGNLLIPGVTPLTFSRSIANLNPSWTELEKPEYGDPETMIDAFFRIAVDCCKAQLHSVIGYVKGLTKATTMVRKASIIDGLMIMDQFCPWVEALFETKRDSLVTFAVYPDSQGTWMCQCCPPEAGSFEKKLPLPEAWAGKRGSDLVDLTGVEDAVFCHPGRYIAGAQTRAGAMRLAHLAMVAETVV